MLVRDAIKAVVDAHDPWGEDCWDLSLCEAWKVLYGSVGKHWPLRDPNPEEDKQRLAELQEMMVRRTAAIEKRRSENIAAEPDDSYPTSHQKEGEAVAEKSE